MAPQFHLQAVAAKTASVTYKGTAKVSAESQDHPTSRNPSSKLAPDMRKLYLTTPFLATVCPSLFQSYKCEFREPGTTVAKIQHVSERQSRLRGTSPLLNTDAGSSSATAVKTYREPFVLPSYEDHRETLLGTDRKKYALEVINSNHLTTYNAANAQHPENDPKIKEVVEKLNYFSARAKYLATMEWNKESFRLQRMEYGISAEPEIKSNSICFCGSRVLSTGLKTTDKTKGSCRGRDVAETKISKVENTEKDRKFNKKRPEKEVKNVIKKALIKLIKTTLGKEANEKSLAKALGSTGVDITRGLQELLKYLDFGNSREILNSLPWQVRCERAVFEVIAYMFRFKVITAEEMAEFFSEEETRQRTGKHIAKLFPDGLDAHFGTHKYFRPDLNYLTMTWQTKHLHHCLAELDQFLQKSIISIAFGASLKMSQAFDWWKTISQESKLIASSMTRYEFLEGVSRWEKAPRILSLEKNSGMSFNRLFHNLTGKDEANHLRLYGKNQHEYFLNLLLMDYFVLNLSDVVCLMSFFKEESTCHAFYNRFQLISASRTLLSWNERLSSLEQNSTADIQKKEIFSETDQEKIKSYVKSLTALHKKLKTKHFQTSVYSDAFMNIIYELVDQIILDEENGIGKIL